MVVRENRIPLFTLSGHETKAPAKCSSPQVPLHRTTRQQWESSSGIGGHNGHVNGYQIAPGAVIQPELHSIAGCRGIASAVRPVEPPRSGFIVHEAEASFGIEKLDESLHGFAAPTNEREEEQDTNSGRIRHPIWRAWRACWALWQLPSR
jgi:hypothetical protein